MCSAVKDLIVRSAPDSLHDARASTAACSPHVDCHSGAKSSVREHLCYTFTGPGGHGSMDEVCNEAGVQLTAIDIERSSNHDVLNDAFFDDLVQDMINMKFTSLLQSPPCSTFSAI